MSDWELFERGDGLSLLDFNASPVRVTHNEGSAPRIIFNLFWISTCCGERRTRI